MRHKLFISGLLLVAACDDDGGSGRKVDCSENCYVLASAISGPDGATTYVHVMDHIESGELDFADAAEFPGWSDMKVHGGRVFVSSGEAPTVQRFSVRDDGELVDEGTISFAAYSTDASMYAQIFVSEDEALLLADTGNFVFWNPSTMEVTTTTAMPVFEDREGLPASPAGDRGTVVRGNYLFEAVAFGDYENYKVAATSAIVVIDRTTHQVVATVDADCPDLNVGVVAPSGDIYFSNWVYSPATSWLFEGAPTCAVVIPAGSNEVDPARTLQFRALSGGHDAAVLGLLTGGRGIVSVFDESKSPYVEGSAIFPWIFGNNWSSFQVDLATGALTELVGLPAHGGGYYQSVGMELDYVLLPEEGYTRTSVWEIDAAGTVAQKMTMDGWATRFMRVR